VGHKSWHIVLSFSSNAAAISENTFSIVQHFAIGFPFGTLTTRGFTETKHSFKFQRKLQASSSDKSRGFFTNPSGHGGLAKSPLRSATWNIG
jgi:hypothetical protein